MALSRPTRDNGVSTINFWSLEQVIQNIDTMGNNAVREAEGANRALKGNVEEMQSQLEASSKFIQTFKIQFQSFMLEIEVCVRHLQDSQEKQLAAAEKGPTAGSNHQVNVKTTVTVTPLEQLQETCRKDQMKKIVIYVLVGLVIAAFGYWALPYCYGYILKCIEVAPPTLWDKIVEVLKTAWTTASPAARTKVSTSVWSGVQAFDWAPILQEIDAIMSSLGPKLLPILLACIKGQRKT